VAAPALGVEADFPLDDATRQRFLEGLDDIGITLQSEGAIATFEASRHPWLPSTTTT
jgi:3-isopropylmalate/(R)-2-methylmalate dehydratase small subunit